MKSVLFKNVTKKYKTSEVVLLKDMDISLEQGEIISILGPSGSGKTTLLNLMGGLDREFEGTIEVMGLNVGESSEKQLSQLRSLTVGYLFQSYNLLEHLNVYQNITLPSLFNKKIKHEITKRANFLIEKTGLASKTNKGVRELSGGERQRVALARAMFNRPGLLLCDEPTGNLDRETAKKIMDMLFEFNKLYNTTIIIVTHELWLSEITQKKYKLTENKLIFEE